jgi:hypothetical protein
VPENAGVANLREFFDELAAVVLQTPSNLPVLYPVWSLEKILNVRGMGPKGGFEGLRLSVLDSVVPEFNSQFLDYAFLHKNLSGGIGGSHPVNLGEAGTYNGSLNSR